MEVWIAVTVAIALLIPAALLIRRVRARKPPAGEKEIPKSEQAVFVRETLEALREFDLPGTGWKTLVEGVQTVEELERVVAQLRHASMTSVQAKMLPLAVQFLRERGIKDVRQQTRLAQVIIAGQGGAPKYSVHPAFASIKGDLAVIWDQISNVAEEQLQMIKYPPSEQPGPELWSYPRREYDEFTYRYYTPQESDWLAVSDTGFLQVLIITWFDVLGKETKQRPDLNYEPWHVDEERRFWIAYARERIQALVSGTHARVPYIQGDLLTMTRFMEALLAREASVSKGAPAPAA